YGRLWAVGIGNWVMAPLGVIRPTLFPSHSVNQTLPSWPVVIPNGSMPTKGPCGLPKASVTPPPAVGAGGGIGNSVTWPRGVMRPILSGSVNHRLPSGPAVIPLGLLSGVGMAKRLTRPAGVMRAILYWRRSVNQMLPSGPSATPDALLP